MLAFLQHIYYCVLLRYTFCKCCKRPWALVTPHTTLYAEQRGCFPLCIKCWQERTPEQRLPYYIALWGEEWRDTDVPLEVIIAACLHEKSEYIIFNSLQELRYRLSDYGDEYIAEILGPEIARIMAVPEEVNQAWSEAEY